MPHLGLPLHIRVSVVVGHQERDGGGSQTLGRRADGHSGVSGEVEWRVPCRLAICPALESSALNQRHGQTDDVMIREQSADPRAALRRQEKVHDGVEEEGEGARRRACRA